MCLSIVRSRGETRVTAGRTWQVASQFLGGRTARRPHGMVPCCTWGTKRA